jgi:hypothetical protein
MPEFRGAAGAPVSRGPRASHTTEPVALAPTAVARKVESAKADFVWLLLRIYPPHFQAGGMSWPAKGCWSSRSSAQLIDNDSLRELE